MEIRENVILAPYTTFRIGGPARYFIDVQNTSDLREVLIFSKEHRLRFFVLGGGSNILISDKGFDGLVIKMSIKGFDFKDEGDHVLLTANAGENWDNLVGESTERNLSGIENLSLIPGTAGGAVCQNIGAYGVEIKDCVESVVVLDFVSGEIKTIENKDCGFDYRTSIFKNNKSLVVLNVDLKLFKNKEPDISYPDLAKRFQNEKPSVADIRKAVIEIRRRKLPYPDEIGNVGSFFKNPKITKEHFDNLVSENGEVKGFLGTDGLVKLSSAQLIEMSGWKGKRMGNVGVSEKHSLVLVNYGHGSSREMLDLAENIKKDVRDKFGMDLEPEAELV